MAIGIASVIVRKRTILPHDRSPASPVARLAGWRTLDTSWTKPSVR